MFEDTVYPKVAVLLFECTPECSMQGVLNFLESQSMTMHLGVHWDKGTKTFGGREFNALWCNHSIDDNCGSSEMMKTDCFLILVWHFLAKGLILSASVSFCHLSNLTVQLLKFNLNDWMHLFAP